MFPRDPRLRFLLASGLAAAISIAIVEVARMVLDLSNPWTHMIVVAGSYFSAARVNFELQRRWTFDQAVVANGWRLFCVFVLVNGSLSLAVGSLSAWLVRWPPLAQLTGAAATSVSLIAAALAVAPLSFVLTRYLVQGRKRQFLATGCQP